MTDIQKWLEDIGLARYSEIFVENDINMEIAPISVNMI
ncbi:MAG: SAM domain-containing protein [Gammaproteobacteria bacterium]|nr:SAM domain-containing protein [Gammaproteobacteria bacterium]MDH3465569.1 SAM domain-containing protein [Gammaproteobacteria bacterium]